MKKIDKLITEEIRKLKADGISSPMQLKGNIDQWSQRVLSFLRLYYRTVKLKEDYMKFMKGKTGDIGRHDPYVSWWIFDAKVEIPVVFKWDDSDGHITQGVPYELLEFVEDENYNKIDNNELKANIHEAVNEKLPADFYHHKNKEAHWIAFVGKKSTEPTFICLYNNNNNVPLKRSEIQECSIISNTLEQDKMNYDIEIIYNSGVITNLRSITKAYSTDMVKVTTLVNTMLLNRIPIKNVVEKVVQLNFHEFCIGSWQGSIYRTLIQYLPASDSPYHDYRFCPECRKESIRFHRGSLECNICGYCIDG